MLAATVAMRRSPSDHLWYKGTSGTFRKKYARSLAANAAVSMLSAPPYSSLVIALRLRKRVVDGVCLWTREDAHISYVIGEIDGSMEEQAVVQYQRFYLPAQDYMKTTAAKSENSVSGMVHIYTRKILPCTRRFAAT